MQTPSASSQGGEPERKGGAMNILGGSPDALAAIFGEEAEPVAVEPGNIIGNYKLVSKIADGGFGSVWRAEQQEPVVRDVALKLIRPDRASPEIISRFERERQALAMMDHENIAKVFDAGEHEGQLFFAMEYVPGKPITEHVKEHGLSLKQRVELFIPICRAVHHAHMKQVLHRDLKPSNILVTTKAGTHVPKVIDFGIAKALTSDHAMLRADSGSFPVTQLGYVIGTPQYMSPEQARGSADIDAASDIYTLGIILYEIFVGEPPVSSAELAKQHDQFALLNFIIHHEPALPSTLWLQANTRRTLALDATLGKDPRRISRQMREDLDWIILHALEKDRSRRYASADALADDLQRHLNHEPVSVGPPSAGYRFRKFYQRNRVATIAAVLVLTSVLAGGGVAAWQWHETLLAKNQESVARQHADEARAAESVARESAVKSQLLAEAREREAKTARDKEAKARAAAEMSREQEARARHAAELARNQAEDLINFMLYDLRDRLEPLNRTSLLATVADKAEHYFTAQAATLDDTPEQARNRAAMHQNKGLIELAQGKTEAARTSFAAFLKLAEDKASKLPASEAAQSDLALAHNRLGMAAQAKGDLVTAQREYLSEQAIVKRLLATKPTATAWRLHLATTHEHLGDVSQPSLPHFEACLTLLEPLHSEEPDSVEITRALATCHEKIGLALSGDKRTDKALSHFDQQLALLEKLPAALASDVRIRRARAVALQAKGSSLLSAGRSTEALPVLRLAVESSQSIAVADPANQRHQQDLANVEAALGSCHFELGKSALLIGTPASIQDARQHFNEGLNALKTPATNPRDEAIRAELQRRFEQALVEIQRLIPGK